jgi:hypothetical protein
MVLPQSAVVHPPLQSPLKLLESVKVWSPWFFHTFTVNWLHTPLRHLIMDICVANLGTSQQLARNRKNFPGAPVLVVISQFPVCFLGLIARAAHHCAFALSASLDGRQRPFSVQRQPNSELLKLYRLRRQAVFACASPFKFCEGPVLSV